MPQLNESAKPATADANGKATCQVQPLRAFEQWHITRITVQSTSVVKIPSAKLYRGGESPSTFIEGTYTGTFNGTSNPVDLENGERLLAVFENCDVGAVCSMTVTGEKSGRV